MNIIDIKVGNVYKIKTHDKLKPHGLFNFKGDLRKILMFKSKYLTWSDCNDKEIYVIGYQTGFIVAYFLEFKEVTFLLNPSLIENTTNYPSKKSEVECGCSILTLVMTGCACGAFKAEKQKNKTVS